MSRDPLAPYTIESFLRDVSRSGGRALNAVRCLAGAVGAAGDARSAGVDVHRSGNATGKILKFQLREARDKE